MESVTDLLGRIEGGSHTLTIYNYDGSTEVVASLREFFGKRNTTVETASTPSGKPAAFAVLREGDRFLAASPVEPAYRAIGFDPTALSNTAFESVERPAIVEHAATTAFTSYGKRRMIVASREIETRAWRVGAGELRAGFQRLSTMGHQWDVYAKLVRRGIDTHAYGVPDWTPPNLDDGSMTFHGIDDEEVRDSWFVVFDGGGEDRHKAALVSEERAPDEFYGFWTYEPTLVDEVLAYFRGGRTAVPSTATEPGSGSGSAGAD